VLEFVADFISQPSTKHSLHQISFFSSLLLVLLLFLPLPQQLAGGSSALWQDMLLPTLTALSHCILSPLQLYQTVVPTSRHIDLIAPRLPLAVVPFSLPAPPVLLCSISAATSFGYCATIRAQLPQLIIPASFSV
jgi:hypothetical protein